MSKENKVPTILIEVVGGLVQSVYSTAEVNVRILDYDIREDSNEVQTVDQVAISEEDAKFMMEKFEE